MMFRKGQASNFQFIAKNPPALLIAGGILLHLFGDERTGMILIILGLILQLMWLGRGRLF